MDHEKMYETCYMKVYSFVMTLCRDHHTAEEITQNTFFKAFGASRNASFRGESDELTWLCSIAKNLFLDECRKNSRRGILSEDAASADDIESKVVDDDDTYRIHVALHTLEEPYKEVFQLRVFGELPFSKIGAIFGKSDNWARVTYHRAVLKIRERIRDNE